MAQTAPKYAGFTLTVQDATAAPARFDDAGMDGCGADERVTAIVAGAVASHDQRPVVDTEIAHNDGMGETRRPAVGGTTKAEGGAVEGATMPTVETTLVGRRPRIVISIARRGSVTGQYQWTAVHANCLHEPGDNEPEANKIATWIRAQTNRLSTKTE